MSVERVQYRGLTMLLFPPSELSLYAHSAGGDRAVPHTSTEALRNSGGEAVLDGPMFAPCDPLAEVPYARQECGHVLYKHFDLSSGIDFGSQRSSSGMTISVMPDGSTVAASGSTAAPGARVSVQGYPSLVIGGDPAPVADQGAFSYVAALAVMSDGRMAFVIGRNMSLPTFAEQLADAGARYGFYTDGGGSASLETLNEYVGHSEHRRVLTWLVAKPSVAVGLPSALGLAAIAVVTIGVGWWLLRGAMPARGLSVPRRNPSVRVLPPDARWGTLASWIASLDESGVRYTLTALRDGPSLIVADLSDDQRWTSYKFGVRDAYLLPGVADSGEDVGRTAPLHVQVIAQGRREGEIEDELFAIREEAGRTLPVSMKGMVSWWSRRMR